MKTSEIIPLQREALEELLLGRHSQGVDNEAAKRRRAPRWPFEGTVELWLTDETAESTTVGDTCLLGECVNLSCAGMGIRIDEPLEPGVELPIAIHQPERSFHGRAVVRHCNAMEHDFFCGMEFIF
jgi:hypothetical protein